MDTLLAAVDDTEATQVVAEYTGELAALSRGKVLGAYVVDTRLVPEAAARKVGALAAEAEGDSAEQAIVALLEQHGTRGLRDVQKVCARKGVFCEGRLEHGAPARVLASLAPLYDMAVLSNGLADKESKRSRLSGTAADFIRLSTRPFLLVRRNYREVREVLVGYDGSAEATRALDCIIPLARAGQWRVTVAVAGDPRNGAMDTAAQAARFKGLDDVLGRIEVRAGEPADVLLGMARELPADLVVVGSRGMNRLARMFLGSTSDALLREAATPVMVFR